MPSVAKKRGRPPKLSPSSSSETKTSLSSSGKKKRDDRPLPKSSPSSTLPIKRPRGRPPKSKQVSTNSSTSGSAPISLFDPRLPPPPPPPPPVNNPFYLNYVKDYWQKHYPVMNIPGTAPTAAAAARTDVGGDVVESTFV